MAARDDGFRIRGIVRIGSRRSASLSVALVSPTAIVLDSSTARVHLPKGSPQVVVDDSELRATVPEWGLAQFVPWRPRRWATALQTTGWLAPSDRA